MSYYQFVEFLESIGELHGVIDEAYNPLNPSDLAGMMQGVMERAIDHNMILVDREGFDEQAYFEELFGDLGL